MTILRMKIKTLFLISLCSITTTALACTDFRITAKDGTVMITRSLEFGTDLQSNVRTSNRNRLFTTTAPDGKPGITWRAKYGYVYLDALNNDFTLDGMNEKGLSFEALYLPGLAGYQTVPAGKDNQALPYLNIGDWILSNFSTINEVKAALNTVYVFQQSLPNMDNATFPLHFSIFEPSGKGLVVEYVGGKLSVYDNNIGVMTNSPTYDWHLTNLSNYVHLIPTNPDPVVENGVTIAAGGQGYGMIGIPGDISPPSRFVKIATMLRVIVQPNNATDTLNASEHLINNVDIPLGFTREVASGNVTNESTQWVVFKDLTNKMFYYRTYGDLTLRSVSLAKINFDEKSPRYKMPISNNQYVMDLTNQLLQTKQS